MANSKKGRRRFGNVRNLPSGRWQARYLGPDQVERKAPHTFETERQAESWLTIVEGEIIKGEWSAPDAGNEELGEYGERWIAERKLAPRTRELYEDLFRLWIRPHLGHLTLNTVKPQTIRSWRKRLLDGGTTEPQTVKAYCLLRAILNTAVKGDALIRDNPCRIKATTATTPRCRPVPIIDQVYRVADLPPDRFRALVIVAALSGLRWGELAALRRADVDLVEGIVRVPASSRRCGT